MKRIGIVDVTTIGACICANEIVAESAKYDSSGLHPEFIMHAFSFDRYKKLVIEKNWDKLADLILGSIAILQKAGADFIIIPSVTPHYGIKKIQENSPLPVLNLIEIIANECQIKNYKFVGVLGTKFTMQGGLFNQPLSDKKIVGIVPNDSLCNKIHDLIMNEIIPSKINQTNVTNVANEIKKIECDAYILGCTELPEVYNETNLNAPVIDTTRLLAKKAIEFSQVNELADIESNTRLFAKTI